VNLRVAEAERPEVKMSFLAASREQTGSPGV
jgi:hypothetical protein